MILGATICLVPKGLWHEPISLFTTDIFTKSVFKSDTMDNGKDKCVLFVVLYFILLTRQIEFLQYLLFGATALLFWNHLMLGLGSPVASQYNSTFPPRWTSVSEGVLTKEGGAVKYKNAK